jgi:hypothetical protein
MRHIIVTTCRVHPERMKQFFSTIQQWEQEVMASGSSPEYHALYIGDTDPSRVLLLTRFEGRRQAEAFAATGLLDGFRERILSCARDEPHREAYDLYYAVGPGGPRVTFGEESDPG